MKNNYIYLIIFISISISVSYILRLSQIKEENLTLQLNLLEEKVESLQIESQEFIEINKHDIALLDSKIDTLESVIDKDKKRKIQINKVVAAIKNSIPGNTVCSGTINSGELLRVAGAVVDLSDRYAVPAALVLAVIRQESAFCQKAVSAVGAQGYMQLMPDTAAQVSQEIGISLNVWSSRDNIHLGVAYLSYLITMFNGDISLATKAYNGGPTHVRKVIAGITKEYHAESLDYSNKVQVYMKIYELAGITW